MTDQAEATETIATLDTILKDEPKETEKVEQAKETEPAAKEPDPKEVPGEEGESPSPEEGQSVPVKAVQEERRKRQAAEAIAADLKKQLAEKEKTPPAERPNALEDPEGAIKHLETDFERKLAAKDEEKINERISDSRETYLEIKEDYLAVEKVFVGLAQANPELIREMRASRNPAKFAYEKGKEHIEFQEFLEAKKSGAKKSDENPEKPEESAEETPEAKRKKSALAVPDLINATSTTKGNQPVKRESLDDLLK